MATQNPDYKYYKQLAGTWKSDDGTCVVTLTETVGITMEYGGAVLNGNYGVIPTDHMAAVNPQGFMGMMGMSGFSGDMVYRHDPNEDLQLKLGDKSLKNGDQTIYNIEFVWHDMVDKLHVELSNAATGAKTNILLNRENTSVPAGTTSLKEGETRCECGQIFSSKFCPNCGRQRKEGNTFTCSCGYKGPLSNFCPECGAEILKDLLFEISEYMTTNPPRYDDIKVWKYSDTKLIMQQDKSFRFIPATFIEPAMEIIREHEIDKWQDYEGRLNGAMGGRQAVSYWDGEKMAGTSTDHMPGAAGAYCALYTLFTTA